MTLSGSRSTGPLREGDRPRARPRGGYALPVAEATLAGERTGSSGVLSLTTSPPVHRAEWSGSRTVPTAAARDRADATAIGLERRSTRAASQALARDARRYNLLVAAGWLVLRVRLGRT